jgi:hypothetical protein
LSLIETADMSHQYMHALQWVLSPLTPVPIHPLDVRTNAGPNVLRAAASMNPMELMQSHHEGVGVKTYAGSVAWNTAASVSHVESMQLLVTEGVDVKTDAGRDTKVRLQV